VYYARLRFPLCAGCDRALAAAAARCPYCGTHARHSFDPHTRPYVRTVANNNRGADVRRPTTEAGSNDSA